MSSNNINSVYLISYFAYNQKQEHLYASNCHAEFCKYGKFSKNPQRKRGYT